MGLKEKLKAQHEKSVAQMKQSSKEFKTATGEIKEGLKEAKDEVKEAMKEECPKCGSSKVKNHRKFSFGLFFFSLVVMIIGTMILGIIGFIIGSLIMAIPGIQLIKSVIPPKKECKSCNHIWK